MRQKSEITNLLHSNKCIKKAYRYFYYGLCKRHIYALTSQIRVLPDCIVIGAVRSGTTSLYHYLGQHPCIARSAYDELGFFDSNFELGLNWYRSMFPTVFTKKRILRKWGHFMTYDVTPFYIFNPKVVIRVHSLLPNVRIIAVLRNPVDRAYSNYHLGVRSGDEKRSFEEAIKCDMEKIEKSSLRDEEYFRVTVENSYLARGFYAEQLQMWMEHFPKKQILVISSEDLANKTNETLSKIFEFLQLPDYKIQNLTKQRIGNYSEMNHTTREMLVNYFKSHNEKLYSLLGQKFDWDK